VLVWSGAPVVVLWRRVHGTLLSLVKGLIGALLSFVQRRIARWTEQLVSLCDAELWSPLVPLSRWRWCMPVFSLPCWFGPLLVSFSWQLLGMMISLLASVWLSPLPAFGPIMLCSLFWWFGPTLIVAVPLALACATQPVTNVPLASLALALRPTLDHHNWRGTRRRAPRNPPSLLELLELRWRCLEREAEVLDGRGGCLAGGA
jgi:hypothetical protein